MLARPFDVTAMGNQTVHSSFLFAQNAGFVADMYARFQRDPASIEPSWAQFFSTLGDDAREVLGELSGPSWSNGHSTHEDPAIGEMFGLTPAAADKPAPAKVPAAQPAAPRAPAAAPSQEQLRAAVLDSIRALMLIRTYRVRGHLNANLDPLGLEHREEHPELDPATYGFTAADWDRPMFINHVLGFEVATLRQIMDRLHQTYCDHIGVEFMHIQDPDEKAWIQNRIEAVHNRTDFTPRGRTAILERISATEGFERYLNIKYTGTKRFGLDGGESLMAGEFNGLTLMDPQNVAQVLQMMRPPKKG